MKSQIAPLLLSAFNRPHHLKNALISLERNLLVDDTVLYLSLDGPRTSTEEVNFNQCLEIIKNIKNFKKVYEFISYKNTCGEIIKKTYDYIRSDSPYFVRAEDDLVFSKYFLRFVNEGLIRYRESRDIAAVCGYMYPVTSNSIPESFLLQRFAAWGYGCWRDKVDFSNFNHERLISDAINDKYLYNKINDYAPNVILTLEKVLSEGGFAGDLSAEIFLRKTNKFCLFPSQSLVSNWGFDGTGMNCGVDPRFTRQEPYEGSVIAIHHPVQLAPLNLQKSLYRFEGGFFMRLRNLFFFKSFHEGNVFFKFFYAALMRLSRLLPFIHRYCKSWLQILIRRKE